MKSFSLASSIMKSVALSLLLSPAFYCGALASDARGQSTYECGDYEQSEKYFTLALAKAERGRHDKKYSSALSDLANIYYMIGKMQEAAKVYRQLVTLDEQLYGQNSLHVAQDLYGLSRCLRRQSLYEEADPVLVRVLNIRRNQLGEEHMDVARSWLDLAQNYHRMGKLNQAKTACQKSIAIRESLGEPGRSRLLLPALQIYSGLLAEIGANPEVPAAQPSPATKWNGP